MEFQSPQKKKLKTDMPYHELLYKRAELSQLRSVAKEMMDLAYRCKIEHYLNKVEIEDTDLVVPPVSKYVEAIVYEDFDEIVSRTKEHIKLLEILKRKRICPVSKALEQLMQ